MVSINQSENRNSYSVGILNNKKTLIKAYRSPPKNPTKKLKKKAEKPGFHGRYLLFKFHWVFFSSASYPTSRWIVQLSASGSLAALLSRRKKSELAAIAKLLPCSSSTLLSQAMNDSSVMISSSYKLSKYDLMKPGWVKNKIGRLNEKRSYQRLKKENTYKTFRRIHQTQIRLREGGQVTELWWCTAEGRQTVVCFSRSGL